MCCEIHAANSIFFLAFLCVFHLCSGTSSPLERKCVTFVDTELVSLWPEPDLILILTTSRAAAWMYIFRGSKDESQSSHQTIFASLLHVIVVLCFQKTGCNCFCLCAQLNSWLFSLPELLKHKRREKEKLLLHKLLSSFNLRTLFIHHLFSGCAIVARALWWEAIRHSLPLSSNFSARHLVRSCLLQRRDSELTSVTDSVYKPAATFGLFPKIFTRLPSHTHRNSRVFWSMCLE